MSFEVTLILAVFPLPTAIFLAYAIPLVVRSGSQTTARIALLTLGSLCVNIGAAGAWWGFDVLAMMIHFETGSHQFSPQFAMVLNSGLIILAASICMQVLMYSLFPTFPRRQGLVDAGVAAAVIAVVLMIPLVGDGRHGSTPDPARLLIMMPIAGIAWHGLAAVGITEWTRDELRKLQVLKPTCHICQYDLAGLQQPRCPECGTEIPRPCTPQD